MMENETVRVTMPAGGPPGAIPPRPPSGGVSSGLIWLVVVFVLIAILFIAGFFIFVTSELVSSRSLSGRMTQEVEECKIDGFRKLREYKALLDTQQSRSESLMQTLLDRERELEAAIDRGRLRARDIKEIKKKNRQLTEQVEAQERALKEAQTRYEKELEVMNKIVPVTAPSKLIERWERDKARFSKMQDLGRKRTWCERLRNNWDFDVRRTMDGYPDRRAELQRVLQEIQSFKKERCDFSPS